MLISLLDSKVSDESNSTTTENSGRTLHSLKDAKNIENGSRNSGNKQKKSSTSSTRSIRSNTSTGIQESSPITTLELSEIPASANKVKVTSKQTSTPHQSNSRIIDSDKSSTSSSSYKKPRRQYSTVERGRTPVSAISAPHKVASTTTSRVVLTTPITTQIALHTLTEYSEFKTVFKNANLNTYVRQFHAFINDVGQYHNSKNTPMREMIQKTLTKIGDSTAIRKSFGDGTGVQIVNAVRDIIVLQIPRIISK
jgi:hypothetical protein